MKYALVLPLFFLSFASQAASDFRCETETRWFVFGKVAPNQTELTDINYGNKEIDWTNDGATVITEVGKLSPESLEFSINIDSQPRKMWGTATKTGENLYTGKLFNMEPEEDSDQAVAVEYPMTCVLDPAQAGS